MAQETIFERIRDERHYQVRRWGYRQPDGQFIEPQHSVGDFLIYMQDYLTEAVHQASRNDGNEEALSCLRRVVALGISCFEQHGVPARDTTRPCLNGRDGELA
jgi:hypothetical protein